jgi:hypothetical protein
VKTRWDSVYAMIQRLREMQPVGHDFNSSNSTLKPAKAIEYFLASPNNKDLAKYRMTEKEWEVLADFEVILEVCVETIPRSDTDTRNSAPCSAASYVRRDNTSPFRRHSRFRDVHVPMGTSCPALSTHRTLDCHRPTVGLDSLCPHGSYSGLHHIDA